MGECGVINPTFRTSIQKTIEAHKTNLIGIHYLTGILDGMYICLESIEDEDSRDSALMAIAMIEEYTPSRKESV